jgi:hypothetical protein
MIGEKMIYEVRKSYYMKDEYIVKTVAICETYQLAKDIIEKMDLSNLKAIKVIGWQNGKIKGLVEWWDIKDERLVEH